MEKTKERLSYLDVSRGVVIILMLIGHAWDAPPLLLQVIFGFHIPFFFVLSGYLYNHEKYGRLGFKHLVKTRWKAYVIPYFVLSFVNLVINIPIELLRGFGGKELLLSTGRHLFWIFYSWGSSTRTPNCTPLWFLLCLFVASVYFYCLLKIKNTSLQVAMCVLAVALDVCLSELGVPQLPWHIEIALLGAVFLYIGFKLKESKIMERIDGRMPVAAAVLVSAIVGFYCVFTNPKVDLNPNLLNNVVLLYVGAVAVTFSLLLFCKHAVKRCAFLEYFGKNTILVIGFNHAINTYSAGIWSMIPGLSDKFAYTWWLQSIIDVVCCVIIIWLWNKIKGRYPRLNLF